ncbi:4Fe-4S binding protein [bacterium]|nr:4Fe-4S binding protein [bacterium]
MMSFRIIQTGGNLIAIGAVFVTMCLVTTIIAIVLGIPMKQRAWCMVCPMGTLQRKIGKIAQRRTPVKREICQKRKLGKTVAK